MTDYRTRLEAVANLIQRPPSDDVLLERTVAEELATDLRSLLSEADSLRADITALEDGNMTFMCDQLDKAKAENARMREALEKIADGSAPPDPHGHYLAHRRAVDVARQALSLKAG